MLIQIVQLFRIFFRDRPIELKPGVRYRVTLDLAKLQTSIPSGGKSMTLPDVNEWLMKIGLTPTTQPQIWKADERFLRRLPAGSIVKAEKL